MTGFYRLIAVLMIGLWVPITSHCYLEESGMLKIEQEQCCAGESSPAQGDPCDTGCKIIEKSGAKVQVFQKFLLPSAQTVLLTLKIPPPLLALSQLKIVCWPPRSLNLPQFVTRTSLPVRAPSLVS